MDPEIPVCARAGKFMMTYAVLRPIPGYMSELTAPIVPDSQHRGLVALLPPAIRDYALLARFDRPIGWWLLFWPCAWGVLLAGGEARWRLILWLLLGIQWLMVGI